MKPVLKYPGAKWRIAQWIIEKIPPHIGYVEPFFGSGAVFFNKEPSYVETLNDIDGEVVRFFKTCREKPDELAYALSLTPWSRQEFLDCDFCDNCEEDVEAARKFAVRCWMTFGARTRTKTSWRHTTGGNNNPGPDNAKLWGRLPEIVQQVSARILHAQIENRPAVQLFSIYNGPKVLFYLDPPYVKSTRTLSGDQYRFEMTEANHFDLLSAAISTDSMVMISGYRCDLYDDMLSGWDVYTKNTTAERGVRRMECLWLNSLASENLRREHGQLRMF